MFVTTKHLSRQIFVATNTCLSWQVYFCRDKHVIVATNIILTRQKFCRDKHTFVATKDFFVVTNTFYRDKNDTCGGSRQWYPPPPPLYWPGMTACSCRFRGPSRASPSSVYTEPPDHVLRPPAAQTRIPTQTASASALKYVMARHRDIHHITGPVCITVSRG